MSVENPVFKSPQQGIEPRRQVPYRESVDRSSEALGDQVSFVITTNDGLILQPLPGEAVELRLYNICVFDGTLWYHQKSGGSVLSPLQTQQAATIPVCFVSFAFLSL